MTVQGDPGQITALLDGFKTPGVREIDFEKIIPMPDTVTEAPAWRVEHWGTQGNTVSTAIRGIFLTFKTPWTVPTPIFKALAEQHPELKFKFEWSDESMGWNTGRWTFEGGELSDIYEPEFDKELAFNVWDI